MSTSTVTATANAAGWNSDAFYSFDVYPQYCNMGTTTLMPSRTKTIVEKIPFLSWVSLFVLYVLVFPSAALIGAPGSFSPVLHNAYITNSTKKHINAMYCIKLHCMASLLHHLSTCLTTAGWAHSITMTSGVNKYVRGDAIGRPYSYIWST